MNTTNSKSTEADRREPNYSPGAKYSVGALVTVRSGHKKGQLVQVWDVKGSMLLVRNWMSNERSRNFWISDHKVQSANPNEAFRRIFGMSILTAKLTAQENADLDDLMADYEDGKTWTTQDTTPHLDD
jgi:hypothetical protein